MHADEAELDGDTEMKAQIQNWEIKELGPALNTRMEHSDGSVSYDSMNEVSLRVRVIGGNDAANFLNMIKQLSRGAEIKRIDIKPKNTGGRKYVFE